MSEGATYGVRIKDQTKAGAESIKRNFEQMGQKAEVFSKKTKEANSAMATAKGTMGGLRSAASSLVPMIGAAGAAGAVALFTGAVVDAVKTAAQFESAMAKVKAVTGATGQQFDNLSGLAREMGASTGFTAMEAAEGIQFLGMAGFETNEILTALPATLTLATAGAVSLGTAADIASNILSGMRMPVDELDKVVDGLAVAAASSNTNVEMLGQSFSFVSSSAAQMGLDFADVTAALGQLGNAGIQGSRGGTNLAAAMASLAKPTESAKKIMKAAKLEFFEADGSMKDLVSVVRELEGASLSAGQMLELFGMEGGRAIGALAGQGADSLETLREKILNSGGAAGEMAATQMDTFEFKLKAMASAADDLKIELGTKLLPVLTDMVEAFTEVSRAAGSALQTASKFVEEASTDDWLAAVGSFFQGMNMVGSGGGGLGMASGMAMAGVSMTTSNARRDTIAAEAFQGPTMEQLNPAVKVDQAAIDAANAAFDLAEKEKALTAARAEASALLQDTSVFDEWVGDWEGSFSSVATWGTIWKKENELRIAGISDEVERGKEALRFKQEEVEWRAKEAGATDGQIDALKELHRQERAMFVAREQGALETQAATEAESAAAEQQKELDKKRTEGFSASNRVVSEAIGLFGRFTPEMGEFSAALGRLATGDYIGAISSAIGGLVTQLDKGAEELEESAQRLEKAAQGRATGSGAAVAFAEKYGGEEFVRTQYQVIEPLIRMYEDINQKFDRQTPLENMQSFFQSLGMITEETAGSANWKRQVKGRGSLISAIEASDQELVDWSHKFVSVFGKSGDLVNAASQMFEIEDAFKALEEETEKTTKAIHGLTDAEGKLNRARFQGEVIRAQSTLAEDYRLAGSDVFLQRQAMLRYQGTVAGIGASASASSGGGSSVATGTTASSQGAAKVSVKPEVEPLILDTAEDWKVLVRGSLIDEDVPLVLDGNNVIEFKPWQVYDWDKLIHLNEVDMGWEVFAFDDVYSFKRKEVSNWNYLLHENRDSMGKRGLSFDSIYDFSRKEIYNWNYLLHENRDSMGRRNLSFDTVYNFTPKEIGSWGEVFTLGKANPDEPDMGVTMPRIEVAGGSVFHINKTWVDISSIVLLWVSRPVTINFEWMRRWGWLRFIPARVPIDEIIDVDYSGFKDGIARTMQEALEDRQMDIKGHMNSNAGAF